AMWEAYEALGELGPEGRAAVPALLRAVQQKDPAGDDSASRAVKLLAQFGPDLVPQFLEAVKEHPPWTLVGIPPWTTPLVDWSHFGKGAVPALLKALHDPDPKRL